MTTNKKQQPKPEAKNTEAKKPDVKEEAFKLTADRKRRIDERAVDVDRLEWLQKDLEKAIEKEESEEQIDLIGHMQALHGACANMKAAMEARAERVRVELETEQQAEEKQKKGD